MIRNILWGLFNTVGGCLLMIGGMLLVSAFSPSMRSELGELGLPLFTGFILASVICGLILGILRPLARFSWGPFLISGILTPIALLTQFAILGGTGVFDSLTLFIIVLIPMILVGAAFAPLWRRGETQRFSRGVDRFLDGVFHEAVISSRTGQRDPERPNDKDDGAAV